MNKNTQRNQKFIRSQPFVTQGYKKKAKPFPTPNGEGMSLIEQKKFLGLV